MIPSLIPVLIEAALRALVLALAVWAGLRLLRVGNVLAQKTVWGLVLAAAALMPLLMPLIARWQWMPSAAVHVPAWSQPANPHAAAPVPNSPSLSAQSGIPASRQDSTAAEPQSAPGDRYPAPLISSSEFDTPPASRDFGNPAAIPQTSLRHILRQSVVLGWLLYLCVSAALLVRLCFGLGFAARLWWTAKPVDRTPQFPLPASLRLRSTPRVASPVAIGSGILLPVNYAAWDAEKLRVVLAHEYSHIRQGDFYLQILARLYASLFWFSPLGWWLQRKLSDLGEAISDRAGLEHAASRSSYAQVLLEFAALPRPTLIGVAMARSSSLSDRIDRFLNESTFRLCFTGSRRRAFVAVLLVPVALFAATALIRVEAAASAQPATPVRAALQALVNPQAAPAPKAPVTPIAPAVTVSVPAPEAAPAPVAPIAPVAEIAGLPVRGFLVGPMHALIGAFPRGGDSDRGPEATFERTLSVSGQVELSVITGSGNIHLTRGNDSSIHIHGIVKANENGNEEQVRQVAANPPIEQTGSIVRIGSHQENQENMRHLSISYEITAPAGAILKATSGSGNVTDEGVGQQSKLTTGSGNIHATGLRSGFDAQTGSGNIYVEQSGQGEVKAQTGSGDVEVKGVLGGLKAQTGSGNIKVNGTPTADWKLQTGSGDVELWTGNAPLTIDATYGSGGLHTDREMLTQGSSDHHHTTGKLNGGGPLVRVETGSGEIRVH
jgi:hypothetical protein